MLFKYKLVVYYNKKFRKKKLQIYLKEQNISKLIAYLDKRFINKFSNCRFI